MLENFHTFVFTDFSYKTFMLLLVQIELVFADVVVSIFYYVLLYCVVLNKMSVLSFFAGRNFQRGKKHKVANFLHCLMFILFDTNANY